MLTDLLGPGWEAESQAVIAARAGITLTGPILGDMRQGVKQAALAIIAGAQQKIEAYQESQRLQNKGVDPMQMVAPARGAAGAIGGGAAARRVRGVYAALFPGRQQLREKMRSMDLTPDQFRELFSRSEFCHRPAGLLLRRLRPPIAQTTTAIAGAKRRGHQSDAGRPGLQQLPIEPGPALPLLPDPGPATQSAPVR